MLFEIKCEGGRHHVDVDDDGNMHLVDHDDVWLRCEQVAHALGGPLEGCYAVWHAWTTDLPGAWRNLPRPLRLLARDREDRRMAQRAAANRQAAEGTE